MEILTAAFGIAVCVLAITWMIAPIGRWGVRNWVFKAGLLLLAIAMMLGYSRSIH